ncbi:hypothetical protein A0J57_05435 [Sphingobium sp. 22B]|uniref:hypothetical protein n=1 Tax=unclassified Sphingobium TaxID=2611147 RepID=UPI0007848837|nr:MULTISPECIES: hypothetical protein [unclassified Sphingobium]KXU31541.1 hypothetical protein AXW74_11815 [Sphingobium sp. AM]KYC33551.1 hypothetical protein A0J57_05435 [Sphingobium sp. 22B]OAP32732.1 hypothetical protein A8O16_07555 [Sphingobium sp. 20006FA]
MLIYRQNYSALAHDRSPVAPDPDIAWIDQRLREKRDRKTDAPKLVPVAPAQPEQPSVTPRKPKPRSARPQRNYSAPILMEIERWLKKAGMPASKFGREAVGDSHLLRDLRRGRDPSSRVVARVRAYMKKEDKARQHKPRPKGKAVCALDLIPRIEKAIAERDMLPSRFGRNVANAPDLIDRIKTGAGIRHETREKVVAYLAKLEWRP